MTVNLEPLTREVDGELRTDRLWRMLYAQDASIYSEEPMGVVFPRSREDVQAIVKFARSMGVPLIPRGGGTSLAGQCVGEGLVVDVGRHMNRILEFDEEARWVRVEPGVILEELNRFLEPHGLIFGPDTSTANRCMIGGMIGNNSCGSHSILYGTTKDHVLEVGAVFSDGTWELLREWRPDELAGHLERDDAIGAGLRTIDRAARDHAETIRAAYPPPEVIRRNTGYRLDDALCSRPYSADGAPFSLARFLCGSEGTLAVTTEAKLSLVELPKQKLVVCAQFESLMEALRATVVAIDHGPSAVELIDDRILEQTRHNLEQQRNRFFIEGDPEAVLVIEFYRSTTEELEEAAQEIIGDLKSHGFGYAFPIVRPPDDERVWKLRKAGLGLLMGIPGDEKAVSVIEDTAVPVARLPDYVGDVMEIMSRYDAETVYHAHASVGELHIRPELNLKRRDGVDKMVAIAGDVADLVRDYRGSLSGEHGDGRVRAPYIERFYGEEVYELLCDVKRAFDPDGIFNPGKIVDPEPIDADLRVEPDSETPEVETFLDWSADMGLVRAVEKCNGAGACRKLAGAGGTMCPSYMVTLDEIDSTRGRANVFRQLLLEGPDTAMTKAELHEAMDLCLSCKGCKSECPANVDMARMKAEFLQHHHDAHGAPLSARFFGHYAALSKLATIVPWLANFVMSFVLTRWFFDLVGGIAPERSLPQYAPRRFRKIFTAIEQPDCGDTVWLYVDPFTEFTEPEIARSAVEVLNACGLAVELLPIDDDGRALISKGLLRSAQRLAVENVATLKSATADCPDRPVVGLEPSALLTFRDEFPDLLRGDDADFAAEFGRRCFLFDEFLAARFADGDLDVSFSGSGAVRLHGHCHQKAMIGNEPTIALLELAGFDVDAIPSGCCGMAGSFGYEAEHHDISMKVGELVLFPAVRDTDDETPVVAPGTSCRHQIADGTSREAVHPAVLLAGALRR